MISVMLMMALNVYFVWYCIIRSVVLFLVTIGVVKALFSGGLPPAELVGLVFLLIPFIPELYVIGINLRIPGLK